MNRFSQTGRDLLRTLFCSVYGFIKSSEDYLRKSKLNINDLLIHMQQRRAVSPVGQNSLNRWSEMKFVFCAVVVVAVSYINFAESVDLKHIKSKFLKSYFCPQHFYTYFGVQVHRQNVLPAKMLSSTMGKSIIPQTFVEKFTVFQAEWLWKSGGEKLMHKHLFQSII